MSQADTLKSIHPQLHTFFVPQIEQIRLNLHAQAGGVWANDDNDIGRGYFFAAQLTDNCLITSHRLQAKSTFMLEEDPERSLCIASLSDVGVALCPRIEDDQTQGVQTNSSLLSANQTCGNQSRAAHLQPRENIAVFSQAAQSYAMQIHTDEVIDSASVCILPSYFESLREVFGEKLARAAYNLMDTDGFILNDDSAPYVRAVLRSLGTVGGSLALQRANQKKLQNVLALLTVHSTEQALAAAHHGELSHAQLVNRAKALIQADPAHPPTVDQLANALHVSRARLCAIFKEETGESVGSFAARERVILACVLLENPHLSVAQVASAAGYAHQSSFADAFKRVTGTTPHQWRRYN